MVQFFVIMITILAILKISMESRVLGVCVSFFFFSVNGVGNANYN